jgi:hypothetical protein
MSDREHPKFTFVPPSELTPWPDNPRTIDRDEFDALCRALLDDPEMMEARPLVAIKGQTWCADGTVIAGNMRLRAVQHLGWRTVPVVYRSLDEQTARMVALRDNKPFGRDNEDELAEMLHGLAETGTDLASLGYTARESKKLLDSVRGGDDEQNDKRVKEQFGVMVVCTNEIDQDEAFRELQTLFGPREGFAVKVVVV